jgi:DNA modification methylase
LDDNSIDSVVCDPPYHLQSIVKRFSSPTAAESQYGTDGAYRRMSKGFMGQSWDGGQIAFEPAVWLECFRVLKPGGHLIAFGGTRTIHRITCAIEDSGFDIRDQICWMQFQGFPKSLNISISMDKQAGLMGPRGVMVKHMNGQEHLAAPHTSEKLPSYKPISPEAQKWEGWGTALKPSYEPAILARKPNSEANIAQNVLKWGTGGINVDACRFAYGDPCWVGPNEQIGDRSITGWSSDYVGGVLDKPISKKDPGSRWPANIYQCPKPARSQKEAGLEHLESIAGHVAVGREPDTAALNSPRTGAGRTASAIKNIHPTVKPIKLMRWLVRLITPPGGTVLDPFLGSGTTAAAAIQEGFDVVGCELTEKYWPIIEGRTDHALKQWKQDHSQVSLF